jgi:hypothetical protein
LLPFAPPRVAASPTPRTREGMRRKSVAEREVGSEVENAGWRGCGEDEAVRWGSLCWCGRRECGFAVYKRRQG